MSLHKDFNCIYKKCHPSMSIKTGLMNGSCAHSIPIDVTVAELKATGLMSSLSCYSMQHYYREFLAVLFKVIILLCAIIWGSAVIHA